MFFTVTVFSFLVTYVETFCVCSRIVRGGIVCRVFLDEDGIDILLFDERLYVFGDGIFELDDLDLFRLLLFYIDSLV